MASHPFLQNPEFDFMVRIPKDADTSNLKIYYVTHDFRPYTIVATSYEEALTVAGFTADDTTKDAEGVY